MGRKKNAAVEALEQQALAKPSCETCQEGNAIINLHGVDVCIPCYEQSFSKGAAEAMRKAGLTQKRDEPKEQWRIRVKTWLGEHSALFRREGSDFKKMGA